MSEQEKIPPLADPTATKFTASQEAWRVFGIMSEFVEATQRLSAIRPAVSIFGSARTKPDSPYYKLAENIARFGDVSMAQVEAAARLVGLHEYILALPQGYDSPVGRDGAMLSGGQRQRVALARALYGDPVLVVLDEPNSSLDDAGDEALANAIRALKARGTTFVLMTHRTSVLAVSDKLLILSDGTQQAFGPRDEVLAALNKASQQAQQAAQQAQQARAQQQVQSAVQPGQTALLPPQSPSVA